MDIKLNHIAYAVKSTDVSIEAFKTLYPMISTYKIPIKDKNIMTTTLISENGTHMIELIEGNGTPNPVENMLKKRHSVFYHTCYEVSDFKRGIELFKDKGFRAMTQPFLTELEDEEYHCKWATHMYHPKLGMIELYGNEYNNE